MSQVKKTSQGTFVRQNSEQEWVLIQQKNLNDTDQNTTSIGIKHYLSEQKNFIRNFIDENRRVLLNASPGSGKTTFFGNLCEEHLKNNSKGRIVFFAPFLIIQGQFKKRLVNNGVAIDFELNHKSKRKELVEKDIIITSTFKSCHYIENDLDENDLLIVDEAHSLFTYYTNENGEKDFAFKMVKLLKYTKAKIVLMTGTPSDGLNELFQIKELRVEKKDLKSKINIQYSNENRQKIAVEFARNCLFEYDAHHLNIIYIKNKRSCELIKDIIEKTSGCTAFVLNSDYKNTPEYEELVQKSKISEGITFLITTNLISTGTNILNKKIGNALMFDELNPVEIKQFSKRFRNKMDIEVDVVNPFREELASGSFNRKQELILQRNKQRDFFKKMESSINEIGSAYNDHLEYDNHFYDDYYGSTNDLTERITNRAFLQEVYFINAINDTNQQPIDLKAALNNFHDVIAVDTDIYEDYYSGKLDLEIEIEENMKYDFERSIDEFIKFPKEHFKAIHAFLVRSKHDYYILKKFSNYLYRHDIKDVPLKQEIYNNVNSIKYVREIVEPLIMADSLINNAVATLYFIKNTKKNKRNKLLASLFFSECFFKYFLINKGDSFPGSELVKNPKVNLGLLNKQQKFCRKALILTFNYLINREMVSYQDLKKHLLDNFKNTIISDLEYFPFSEIKTNREDKITDLSLGFVQGLANGIFFIDTQQKQWKDGGKRKPVYLLKEELPYQITKSKELNSIYKRINEDNKEIEAIITSNYKKIDLNSHSRYINSRLLLLLPYLEMQYSKQ